MQINKIDLFNVVKDFLNIKDDSIDLKNDSKDKLIDEYLTVHQSAHVKEFKIIY